MKYVEAFEHHFAKEKSFTFDDARRLLKSMHASDAYVKLFIYNMLKSNTIGRMSRGTYTFSKDESVIGFGFAPFYYGLEYALTILKLWTQLSDPVVVTTTKAVPGVRQALGKRIIVRRISKRMFFGYEYVKYSGIFVPVSDLEKTLVDFVYYKIGIKNQEIRRLVDVADKAKLIRYAKKARINPKVFGFSG